MGRVKIKKLLKDIFQGFLVIVVSALLALALRVFLFASFKIPTPSMEPAITPGDYIMVNKLIPGPRVYKNFDFLKGAGIETYRFKGYRPVKRNDVLVFNFPYTNWNKLQIDLNVNYVKRCVAIPGDTFYIENGIYKVKGISEILGNLTNQEQLSRIKEEGFRPEIWNCFPYDSLHYNWNVKHFGPLYVPKATDSLAIDTVNYRLYKNLIEYETDKSLTVKNGKVYLDSVPIDHYVFGQNYYFMTGDWVSDSRDSRYWGLLPEDHIVGKAAFIWQSKDMHTGEYRWKRFFKGI